MLVGMHMNLNMSCINLSVADLLRCSFGLSKREVAILLKMLDAGSLMPVSRIAAISHCDRSVVQRALLALLEKKLVEREQHNREGGGYEYLYRARNKKTLKKAVLEKSRRFCLIVETQVSRW